MTITDASKKSLVTPLDNYKAVKTATTKTEAVALRSGTYFGVVSTDSEAVAGYAQLASVTLTVSADKKNRDETEKDKLSAKVVLSGKSYSFKPGKNELAWDGSEDGYLFKSLVSGNLTLKVWVKAEG